MARFPSRSGVNLQEGGNCKLRPRDWYHSGSPPEQKTQIFTIHTHYRAKAPLRLAQTAKPILKAPVVAAEAVARRRAFPTGLGWVALIGATMGILGWRRAKRRRPRTYRRAPLELGARTPKM